MNRPRRDGTSSALDTATLDPTVGGEERRNDSALLLTVVGHPDVARVGEEATLVGPTPLSRAVPAFSRPGSADRFPLADAGVSRQPVQLEPAPDGSVSVSGGPIRIDGQDCGGRATVEAARLEEGAVLSIGRVVLLLHRRPDVPRVTQGLGMVGESAASHALRAQILAVAELDVPVLLRGETGSGKELIARALHDASGRRDRPFEAVNMGAVPSALAASELFGHDRGAFTGADEARPGVFSRAHGGTLFLDEIGETPAEVQVALLRALETGAIQRVGGRGEERVDVRVIAATDADLDGLIAAGAFRAPLLHRLAGFEIAVAPLRARREDIGLLLVHFLREELSRLGASAQLSKRGSKEPPWLGADVVERLVRYDWPGNVRQLRNVARQIAIAHRSSPTVDATAILARLPTASAGGAPAIGEAPEATPRARRRPRDVTEAEIADALAAHAYELEATAEALNISRASLYLLIQKGRRFRTAKDVERDELLAAHRDTGGDFAQMSAKLQVSASGLRMRMRELSDR